MLPKHAKIGIKGKRHLKSAALGETSTSAVKPVDDRGTRDLNFKVSPATHHEFKVTAAARGISMKQLLIESFDAWKEMHSHGPLSDFDGAGTGRQV